MPNFISFIAKRTNPTKPKKDYKINTKKLHEYLYDEEIKLLKSISKLPAQIIPNENPIFFYPGCGADILFPLHYLHSLFPQIQNSTFIFNDIDNNLNMLKTILHEIEIPFSQNSNKLQFYWEKTLITLQFHRFNVFKEIDKIPEFDIYFERAFRIMKDPHYHYESIIQTKLKPNGFLISDSGFYNTKLKKIKAPLKLSAYNEMIIAKKVTESSISE